MRPLTFHELKAAVRRVLARHQGPEQCITMTDLFIRVTGDVVIPNRRYDQTRKIRQAVAELRREGCPIAVRNGNGGGYYWADMEALAEQQRRRNVQGLRAEALLLKLPPHEVARRHMIDFETQQEEHDRGQEQPNQG